MIESLRKDNKDWRIYVIIAIVFAVTMVLTSGDEYRFIIIAVLWFDLLLVRRIISFDLGDLLLFSAMLIFRGIYEESFFDGLEYALRIEAFYQLGKCLADPYDPEKPGADAKDSYSGELVAFVIVVVSTAIVIMGMMNYSYLFSYKWAFIDDEWPYWTLRKFPEWDTPMMSQVRQSFFLILAGTMPVYWIMSFKKNKIVSVIGMILSLVALWLGTLTRGKIAVWCCLFSFLACFFVFAAQKGMYGYRFWIIFGFIIDVIMACALMIYSNSLGWGKWFRRNIWSLRDSSFFKNTFSTMGQAVPFVFEHPFGGSEATFTLINGDEYKYANNSWLDIGIRGGIIPFVIMIAFTVVIIIRLAGIFRTERNAYIYALLAAFSGLTAYNLILYDVMNGSFSWGIYIFLCGLVAGMWSALSGKRGLVISGAKLYERIMVRDNA